MVHAELVEQPRDDAISDTARKSPPGSVAEHMEARRLARLRELAVLDTEPEPLFDELTRWASEALGTPIALISLIDENRQWFKSAVGMSLRETDRSVAFCEHTIRQTQVMVVADAREDERFRDNPFVTGESASPGIRFYAGAPITMPGGERIGTLCVVDHQPRELNEDQLVLLRRLAGLAGRAFLMRESVSQQAWTSRSRLEGELADQATALRDSERWFRDLSELSPVGVFRLDASSRLVYANSRWYEIYGLTPAQSLGNASWAKSLFPEERAQVQRDWEEAVRQRRPIGAEFRVRLPDGRVRHVQAQSAPQFDAWGEFCGQLGVVIDATESVALRQRLWASQALLDRTGAIAGVGGWQLELATQRLTWTAQTCRIHDLPVDHQPTLEEGIRYYAPAARETIRAAVQQGIQNGIGWDLELPLITAQGRAIWVRAQGEVELERGVPARLVGTFQDITHMREVAAQLHRQAHALELLYDSSPAMLLSVNEADEVLTVTEQCLRHFGWGRKAMLGSGLSRHFLRESAQRWSSQLMPRALATGQLVREPLRLLAGDGSPRDVLLSALAEGDPESSEMRVLIVLDDITDALARKAELHREHLLRLQVESHAAELQRLLAERGEMLDVLAHEVRQPLNNASAALQSASAALHGKGERTALKRLQRAQGVLGDVLVGVDNTLAAAALLAGQRPLHKQQVEFEVLMDLAVADLPLDARDQVVLEDGASNHAAPMDMSLMRLALRNVLINALRHTPAGRTVLVRLGDWRPDAASEGASGWLIEVVDQGPGFDRQALDNLFRRGGKGERGGHGLGLYIAHRVLDMHGGRLEVVRTGGQGSTVAMSLPGLAELATIAA